MRELGEPRLEHWQLHQDVDGFLWVYADRQGEAVNTLSSAMIRELDTVLDTAGGLGASGIGILSAKPSGFMAGFDIRAFHDFDGDPAALSAALAEACAVFDRLAGLAVPTVCAVRGFCLGGGLELALACRYRVALDEPATRLGLPEVKLGLHPGFGGCVRLTELLGGPRALPLLVSGRSVAAGEARRLGLVDRLARPHTDLRWVARALLASRPPRRRAGLLAEMASHGPARTALAWLVRRQTERRVRAAHYPAPFAIIDLWRDFGDQGPRMAAAEQASFVKLFQTPAAANLRRVFRLVEGLKAHGKGSTRSLRRVHVVGAGVMGGDIAAWCALRGLEVSLQDRDADAIKAARARARKLFARRLSTPALRAAAAARLIADTEGSSVGRADVVIEAIVEDLDAKRALFAELEPRMADHALLATNTSALPLEDLAAQLSRPERFIGLHFFNPVASLPLVEVIRAQASSAAAMDLGAHFVTRIDKVPLPVRSAPGFLVNRVLAPYLIEALIASQQGHSQAEIDAAAVDFGMPTGPIELADRIGLDVCMQVTRTLGSEAEVAAVNARLGPLIAAGKLGKKRGEGLYRWRGGRPQRSRRAPADDDARIATQRAALTERLITPLLRACEAALADSVVASADEVDAGVILGTGFAPFRGGPLHYLQHREASTERPAPRGGPVHASS